MRRAAVAAAIATALATGAGGASAQHAPESSAGAAAPVSIGFAAFGAVRVDVLRGDTVTWRNDSVRAHTVTADDGGFDSGRLPPSTTFRHAFGVSADMPYHCAFHPFMRGVVGVHDVLLTPPQAAAAPGRPFPLAGRSTLPTGATVAVEADRGAGFAAVATATVGDDGAFLARIVPSATASYRAVAGSSTSPAVTLLVLDRRISLQARRARRGLIVRTRVTPASAGGTVVLQLFLHDHFGWWPVQRARLGRSSSTRFALRLRRRVAVRVLLTLPDGATPLAVSRTVRLGPTRRVLPRG
jgi:plastocyanin